MGREEEDSTLPRGRGKSLRRIGLPNQARFRPANKSLIDCPCSPWRKRAEAERRTRHLPRIRLYFVGRGRGGVEVVWRGELRLLDE